MTKQNENNNDTVTKLDNWKFKRNYLNEQLLEITHNISQKIRQNIQTNASKLERCDKQVLQNNNNNYNIQLKTKIIAVTHKHCNAITAAITNMSFYTSKTTMRTCKKILTICNESRHLLNNDHQQWKLLESNLTKEKNKLDRWKLKKTTFYNVMQLQQAAAARVM